MERGLLLLISPLITVVGSSISKLEELRFKGKEKPVTYKELMAQKLIINQHATKGVILNRFLRHHDQR